MTILKDIFKGILCFCIGAIILISFFILTILFGSCLIGIFEPLRILDTSIPDTAYSFMMGLLVWVVFILCCGIGRIFANLMGWWEEK
jgi:hypothetical protein